MKVLEEMFSELKKAPSEVFPSKYWQELNKKNLQQLTQVGFENFKRTLALNYFTFLVYRKDEQITFLKKNLSFFEKIKAAIRILRSPQHEIFSKKQTLKYNGLTHLLWQYALKNDVSGYLNQLDEPLMGNPPRVYLKNKLISQDLANSVLEFYSIMNSSVDSSQIHNIMELGAGYGRTAYVVLKLLPKVRCFIVDIPPALYVSQKYLTEQFPEKKVFRFRPFVDYSSVEKEIDESEIIFLLPHQIELIPSKKIDLFYNISSLHEMRLDQINYYFREIERLTSRYFYFKQWKVSKIPYDEIVIKEKEYPIPKQWKQVFHRECKVQSHFFEAFYQTQPNNYSKLS